MMIICWLLTPRPMCLIMMTEIRFCGSERNRVSTHGDFDRRCSLVILSGVFIRLQVCAFMFLVGFRRGTYRSNGLAQTGFLFLFLLSFLQ